MQMVAMRHSSLAWWRNLTQRRGSVPQLMCSLRSPQVCLWCLSEQFCSVPAPILHGTVACLKSRPLRPPHCPMLGTKPDLPPDRKEKGVDSLSFPSPDQLPFSPCLLSAGGQVALLVFGCFAWSEFGCHCLLILGLLLFSPFAVSPAVPCTQLAQSHLRAVALTLPLKPAGLTPSLPASLRLNLSGPTLTSCVHLCGAPPHPALIPRPGRVSLPTTDYLLTF